MVAFSEGRVVVGATREASAGFDARVTAQGVDEVLTGALQIAPGLEQATFVEARVGLRPVTRDGSPMIGRLPGYDHVFVCCGHGPYGLLMGPGSAVATCALMLGQPPELDLEPFAPVRFMPTPPAPRVQPDTIDAALDSISAGGEI
jgi:D-amino-acid dehydrogenase